MAHQHEGGGTGANPLLQPREARRVEVVGRFVEQVQVGGRKQQRRQQKPPRLPARQRPRLRFRVQSQRRQHAFRLRREVVASAEAVAFFGFGKFGKNT